MTPLPNPFQYLRDNADANPRGIFSQSADQKMTNAEAVIAAKKIAFELRRLGVKPGQVVALALPDQLGILFTEAVFHEGATSVVFPDGYVSDGVFDVHWVFSAGSPRPQGDARLVTVDARFLQQIEENPYGISPREEPIDTLRIVLTSGTTGTPHAVALGREMERAMEGAAMERWRNGGPYLILMDTGTAWGVGEFFLSVKGNMPFLCVGGARPDAIVRVAAENGVKGLRGSPAQLAAVVEELEKQGRTLPTLGTVISSGTGMPPGLSARLRQVTEGCVVLSSYGSTEAGGATVRTYETDDPFDAGHVTPGSTVEIVDDDDRVVPAGETGRVRYRSPGMVHEYLGDPEATRQSFRDGWFYPGDLGYFRPDGGLSLAGRESELLNAGGVKVNPTRLDNFALRNPRVIDACSFAYPTSSGVLQIGIALVIEDDLDVQALLADFVAEFSFSAPKLLARVDSIPRTSAGKPLRRELAERYAES